MVLEHDPAEGAACPGIPAGLVDEFVATEEWVDGITTNKVTAAATICLAAKVNWWAINHHMGQGAMVSYSHKAVCTVFGKVAASKESVKELVWVF